MTTVAEKRSAPQILKDTMVRKDFQTWKEPGERHKLRWGPPGTKVRMCLERARLFTQSYKQTEGQPEVIRRAKALANILENMTIYIRGGERIVGNFASDPASLPIMPDLGLEWLEEGVKEQWGDLLDEEGHREFKELMDYWRDKCIDARVKALLPDYLKPWVTYPGSGGIISADQYQADRAWPPVNYERVLRLGLSGIREQVEKRLKELHADVPSEGPKVSEWCEQVSFLEAALITLRAAITFAHRFAALAREMASKEADAQRKRELLEIAQNCERVPQHSATTLHQALQSWWFIYLIVYLIESTRHGSPCRFDQLMYPYYKRDKDEGRLTREQALELVEFLWAKVEELGQIAPRSFHVAGSGLTLYNTYTIGGVDEKGRDASNEFSFIVLDASMEMRTCQTNIAFRYHPTINHALVLKAIDCVRTGVGYPEIFNDTVIIRWWMNRGVPLEVARNYCVGSCVSLQLVGKNTVNRIAQPAFIAAGKCLELALNQGRDLRFNKQIGYPTPDPLTFTSIDDVMEAFFKQFNFAMDKIAKIANVAYCVYSQCGQVPFASILLDGAIERARDATSWTEYPYHYVNVPGGINVVDSLAAIKKLVFEDKAISMKELLDVLRSNFEGCEEFRQTLLNKAPKFGNDDDYVDSIAREVYHGMQRETEKFKDIWGYPLTLNGAVAGAYYGAGRATWALPDGKLEGRLEPFADGTVSPAIGRDKRGPTAVIKSTGKIDAPFSQLLNQKFMPQCLEGDSKEKFAMYLKAGSDLGNSHIQFNVVDRETLLDAQKNPLKHVNLIVRVAGYSAYFIDLPREIQNQVIARTTHATV